MNGRTKRPRRFKGDWPTGRRVEFRYAENRPGGVGPAVTEDKCPSCDRYISTTGECRCSA